ncbi:hypothetical protein ACFL3G_11065 [Planctomycetota bacterium]
MSIKKKKTTFSRLKGIYLEQGFLISVMVLAVASIGMPLAMDYFEMEFKKEPLPLKKSLSLINKAHLGQYRVINEAKIQDKDILKALGTEEYIQWTLEDTDEPINSSVRRCSLFITYYELPDRVPHVPEECYAGGGNQRKATSSTKIRINEDGFEKDIPIRHLVFADTGGDLWSRKEDFSVLYLINVNDKYVNNRDAARITLNENVAGKHSYFSKVEWTFFSNNNRRSILDESKAASASRKLLSVILPILEKEHWPEYKKH